MLKSRKLKVLLGTLTGVVGITGVATPLIIHYANKTNQKDNEIKKLTADIESLVQYRHDILTKLAKKIYYLQYMKGGWSVDESKVKADITKQIGTLLHKVDKSLEERKGYLKGEQDKVDTEYATLRQEASVLGVDIIDNVVTARQNNDLVTKYQNFLIKTGVSEEEAENKGQLLGALYDQTLNESKDNLWDDFQFNKELIIKATNQGLLTDPRAKGKSWSSIEKSSLGGEMLSELGLSFIQKKLGDYLIVNKDSDFAKDIVDYSDVGKKYDVGQEIVDKDLSSLFKFNYDKTQGAIIDDDNVNLDDIDVNVDQLKATDDDTYDSENILTETKSFSEYDGYGGTYGLAEFMPGFKLHAKIINKDVTSRSQYCHLELQLGVSVHDPVSGNWTETKWSNNDNNTAQSLAIDLKTTHEEVKYISKNNYYAGINNVEIRDGQYDAKNQTYYGTDLGPTTRATFSQILSTVPLDSTNHYIFSDDNPTYVDPKKCNGIDMPPIVTDGDTDYAYHDTQDLRLKITGCDTNSPVVGPHGFSIKAHWVIVDKDRETSKIFEAKTFGWSHNGQVEDDIWISFYVDPNTAKTIEDATIAVMAMNQFMYVSAMVQVYDDNKNDIDHTIDARQAVGICMDVNCGVISAQIAADVALSIISAGFNVAAVASVALGLAALGFMIASSVIEGKSVKGMKKGRDAWKSVSENFNLVAKSYEKVGATLLSQYNAVIDPTLSFEVKVNASNMVMSTLKVSGFLDDYANFIGEVIRDFGKLNSKDLSDATIADLSNAIANFDIDTNGRNALWFTLASVVSSIASLSIGVFKYKHIGNVAEDTSESGFTPERTLELEVEEVTRPEGEAPFVEEVANTGNDTIWHSYATAEDVSEAEESASEAEVVLEADVDAPEAILGSRGNPLALIVLTAVDAALQIVQAAYDNAEGPSFNADNYDPKARYAISTTDKYFNIDSESNEVMKFQLKDIMEQKIVPTNVEWGLDNLEETKGYVSMNATTGELKLITNPKKELEVNIKAVFQFTVNGQVRHSEVQWIAKLFKA